MVVEADESDRSFLKLSPALAVITNIDREHMDTYGSFDRLVEGTADHSRAHQGADVAGEDGGHEFTFPEQAGVLAVLVDHGQGRQTRLDDQPRRVTDGIGREQGLHLPDNRLDYVVCHFTTLKKVAESRDI